MTALFLAKVLPWLAGLLGIFGILGGAYAAGRKAARQKSETEASEAYADTRERMDDAEIPADDPAALRDSLRTRDPGKP